MAVTLRVVTEQYELTNYNHDKFYRTHRVERTDSSGHQPYGHLIRQWGRRSAEGQYKFETHNDAWQLKKAQDQTYYDRTGKGYQVTVTCDYSITGDDAETIWSLLNTSGTGRRQAARLIKNHFTKAWLARITSDNPENRRYVYQVEHYTTTVKCRPALEAIADQVEVLATIKHENIPGGSINIITGPAAVHGIFPTAARVEADPSCDTPQMAELAFRYLEGGKRSFTEAVAAARNVTADD